MKDKLSLNEKNFVVNSLQQEQRIDGRRIYDFRDLTIQFGPNSGSVEVCIGNTRVYCVVSAEVVEPYPDRMTEGFFHFNTEFSPMADPSFELGRPSEKSLELAKIIEKSLKESRAIDTESLCIIAGEKVWSIRIDIHVLDNDGNLVDCSSIAAITALLHFRRADVTIEGTTATIHSEKDREPVPLSIHHIPICVTFGLFQDGDSVIVDPCWKEEQVMNGSITITINSYAELCGIYKGGGCPIGVDQILGCTKIASIKATEIIELLKNKLNLTT